MTGAQLDLFDGQRRNGFHRGIKSCPAVCFTLSRVKFVDQGGKKAKPSQGQVFFYFGNDVAKFEDAFATIGSVVETHGFGHFFKRSQKAVAP